MHSSLTILTLIVGVLTYKQRPLIPSEKSDQTEPNLIFQEKIHIMVRSAGSTMPNLFSSGVITRNKNNCLGLFHAVSLTPFVR